MGIIPVHYSHLCFRCQWQLGTEKKELRKADDLAIFALSLADAEESLQILGVISNEYGLAIHLGKTEHMAIASIDISNTATFNEAHRGI